MSEFTTRCKWHITQWTSKKNVFCFPIRLKTQKWNGYLPIGLRIFWFPLFEISGKVLPHSQKTLCTSLPPPDTSCFLLKFTVQTNSLEIPYIYCNPLSSDVSRWRPSLLQSCENVKSSNIFEFTFRLWSNSWNVRCKNVFLQKRSLLNLFTILPSVFRYIASREFARYRRQTFVLKVLSEVWRN